MKPVIIALLCCISFSGISQVRPATIPGKTVEKKSIGNNTNQTINSTEITPVNGRSSATTGQPGRTITDKYLNAGHPVPGKGAVANVEAQQPFIGGIYAPGTVVQTVDTFQSKLMNVNNLATTIPGGNDTTFNSNSINTRGVGTNSGAVDLSGQAQFGQTNWGRSRSTVGVSQWTVPPPITATFSNEFPEAKSATWQRNDTDSSVYAARYRSGANWITTSYNSLGQRLDTRTEYPLVQPPRAVMVYAAKQPKGFSPVTIFKLQIQGKPDVYEIRSNTGKIVYVNTEGMEVEF